MKLLLFALTISLTLPHPNIGYTQQSSELIKTPHDKKIASLSWNEFYEQFRCPENLSSDNDRELNINDTTIWFATNSGKPLTIANLSAFRMGLLKEHNCTFTLNNIAKHNVEYPERYLCQTKSSSRIFSKENKNNCSSIRLENNWVNIIFSDSVIVDIMPSRIVKEGDNVKIWSQFYLAKNYAYSNPKFNYDRHRQISRFLCKTQQVQLIQGTYMLGEKVMYERLSNEMITEEIEPETIYEILYKYACK